VGERKALDFGEAVLECVAGYVRETGALPVEEPARPPRTRSTGTVSSSAQASLDLFKSGLGVEEIAAERGLAASTIEGHLAEALEAGEVVDLDRLVSEEKRSATAEAMAELGPAYLAPVKERLGEGYTYGELRLVRAVLNRQAATDGV
jgi:ATP-dependent DNA helicase RecQ